mmetsp:Transcript_7857/g.22584  ORF Transcript_7857/g.22584 Transcript_7857/m.22584 type:complete len:250 (-) Transcript_7857:667-1416(-)
MRARPRALTTCQMTCCGSSASSAVNMHTRGATSDSFASKRWCRSSQKEAITLTPVPMASSRLASPLHERPSQTRSAHGNAKLASSAEAPKVYKVGAPATNLPTCCRRKLRVKFKVDAIASQGCRAQARTVEGCHGPRLRKQAKAPDKSSLLTTPSTMETWVSSTSVLNRMLMARPSVPSTLQVASHSPPAAFNSNTQRSPSSSATPPRSRSKSSQRKAMTVPPVPFQAPRLTLPVQVKPSRSMSTQGKA